ncbi:AbrB/MazE/SpoVT family DNA-binding domain-containing protein [Candidatus Woesearchaeota archaeon]|nr:AbrB/MazE/SpoVT family DNA-binding domain-containing protein [Candidatus Woesearchaeota archaeon]
MKRKVNRVGQNTLTVSLPAKWVKNTGIKAGDELDIEEEGNNLILVKEKPAKKIKTVVLNIDTFNKMLLNRYFHEFYRQGVEEIILKFTKEKMPDYKSGPSIYIDKHVKKLVERFIGLEITSQTKNKIVLQSLMGEEEHGKMDVVQKRVYFLVKEFLDEFVNAIDGDFEKFRLAAYDYHDNIAKFSYYYLRLLHLSDIPEDKKARLFGLFMTIDKAMDKVRHTSERVFEMKKMTPDVKSYLKEIFSLFLEQFDMIFKQNYSIEDLNGLIKRRYSLVKKVESAKFNEPALKTISECKMLLDTMVDFSETYVSINTEKYISATG